MEPIQSRAVFRRHFIRPPPLRRRARALCPCAGGPTAPAAEAPAPAEAAPAAAAISGAAAAGLTKFNEAPCWPTWSRRGRSQPSTRSAHQPVCHARGRIDRQLWRTFRRAFKGVSDRWGPTKCQDHVLALVMRDLNLQARMAEAWETNDDASEWTFHLREGMKWSDGTPFTTEAVQYCIQ